MKLGLGHRNMRYNNKSLNLTENYYILELMLKISLRINTFNSVFSCTAKMGSDFGKGLRKGYGVLKTHRHLICGRLFKPMEPWDIDQVGHTIAKVILTRGCKS